jgi:hypothetical protein
VLPAGAPVRRPLAGKQKQRTANARRQSNTAEAKMNSMGKAYCKAKAKLIFFTSSQAFQYFAIGIFVK